MVVWRIEHFLPNVNSLFRYAIIIGQGVDRLGAYHRDNKVLLANKDYLWPW